MKLLDSKPALFLLGLVGCIAFIVFCYYMTYIHVKLFMWPQILANLLAYIKAPLAENEALRYLATGVVVFSAYGMSKLKRHPKLGIVVAFLEIVGGAFMIFSCFSSKFDNDIAYALTLAGGFFFLMDGFELYSEKYENKTVSDQDK